ncbi:chemotaxis-specific protein-glutamate methyltransferase CheB [Anaeromyxobacter terrae]|uniref:chemotaxis-specific protein-glutamate methyltransferase CheB n=1 Tax=Anaeromyxobacter terrae TaxID=2925406 RepID=UPI001F569C92|nr:chemotaxis-specific protein-glutamate methyltransferase CheB [Anaeromyxobacter sp. SG22]
MIRCLLVDDSRSFRALLRALLERAGIAVVGEAADGDAAVAQVTALRPDVVTMDVRMPGKDGLVAIEEIMRVAPTPIVVVSAEAGPERQELAFWALELGAVEVLAKPRATDAARFAREADAIRDAVRAVAGLRLVTRHRRLPLRPRAAAAQVQAPRIAAGASSGAGAVGAVGASAPRVLGIAASTGGPAALARILRALPREFPAPILVVQHIAPGFEAGLVHWLGTETRLAVKLAADGELLRPGTVYFGAEGRHLTARGDRVRLVDGPPVRGFRPSGTTLLESLAREYGGAAAGLVLSGMGDDGADGLRAVRERGGWTAAQGRASAVVFGMPGAAIERGAAAHTIELDDIAPALLRLARAPAAAPRA